MYASVASIARTKKVSPAMSVPRALFDPRQFRDPAGPELVLTEVSRGVTGTRVGKDVGKMSVHNSGSREFREVHKNQR